jgi:hypothetical protein
VESKGVFTFFTIGFLLVGLLSIALILAALRHDSSEIYAQMGSSSDIIATSFAVIAPKECAVGNEITVTITAIDKDGNAVPSYIGTVNIETNLPDFPNKMTFSAGDFGRQQTKVVVGSTGEFTIKVYDATRDIKEKPPLPSRKPASSPPQMKLNKPLRKKPHLKIRQKKQRHQALRQKQRHHLVEKLLLHQRKSRLPHLRLLNRYPHDSGN